MKRLIAQIGLTYLSVLAVVFYFGRVCAYVLGAISLVLLVLFLCYKLCRETIYLPVMAFVSLLACVVNICYSELVYERICDKYDGYSGMVTATLIEEPVEYYGSYKYTFKTKPTDEFEDKIKFTVIHNDLLNMEPFDVVKVNVELHRSESDSSISQKCFFTGDFGYGELQFTVVDTKHNLYYYAIKLRQAIRELLRDSLSKPSFELCSALLIGDKFALSDEVYKLFREAGVTHLIVVSGTHFSVLASLFFMLARWRYKYRHWFIVLCLLFVIVYMAVTGFSPSVIRSGVMILIYCLSILLSRQQYSPNSLGLSAIVVTFTNPYSVGDVGLILSFATTFAIITLSPKLYLKFAKRIKFLKCESENRCKKWIVRRCNQVIRAVIMFLCMNISASLVSLPLSIVFFGSSSLISMITTLVLNLFVTVLLYLLVILVAVCKIPVVGMAVSVAVNILSNIILSIVHFLASCPYSYVAVKNNFVYLWVIMCVVLFCMMLLCRNRTIAVKMFAVSVLIVFLAGYFTSGFLNERVASLNIFDVDNGTAVLYVDSDVSAVVELDCSNSLLSKTVEKIEQKTDKVDFVSSVSDTQTSVTSLYSLTKVFAISDVLLYDTRRSVELNDNVKNVITPSENFTVKLSARVTALYYFTEDGYIVLLTAGESTTLILPPYIDAENIPEDFRNADNIVINNSPLNSELLSCDTLIISADESYSNNIMKFTKVSYSRVLLTSNSDIEIVEVV